MCHYKDPEALALAEERVRGHDWDVLLDERPRSAPYVIWWNSIDCEFHESPAAVWDRIRKTFGV